MPIEGPIAFRANSWVGGKEVKSPAWPFEWAGAIVWAECKTCPSNEDGHLIPGFDHTCGIWATLDERVVRHYVRDAGGVMYMVEALDDYVLHDSGFRAGGAQVVGIVNTSFISEAPKLRAPTEDEKHLNIKISAVGLSIMAAADKYRVPVIESDVALEMAKVAWLREGMPWPL